MRLKGPSRACAVYACCQRGLRGHSMALNAWGVGSGCRQMSVESALWIAKPDRGCVAPRRSPKSAHDANLPPQRRSCCSVANLFTLTMRLPKSRSGRRSAMTSLPWSWSGTVQRSQAGIKKHASGEGRGVMSSPGFEPDLAFDDVCRCCRARWIWSGQLRSSARTR